MPFSYSVTLWKKKCQKKSAEKKALARQNRSQVPVQKVQIGISKQIHDITTEVMENTLSRLKQSENNRCLENKIEELEENIDDDVTEIPIRLDGKRVNPKVKKHQCIYNLWVCLSINVQRR